MNRAQSEKKGIVYLVGAGPGDPGLITLRGLERLQAADVVVYDRLVAPQLLAQASRGATLVDVGKSSQGNSASQDEINRLLYEHASAGKAVCRLKGGDPFLLGRGGEEASYLAERGIAFEVVPGVTSAIAVPAYAGIPVTDRRFASVVAIATGHEDPERESRRVDWARLGQSSDTIVVLMGAANIEVITKAMIAGGRDRGTPAAVIERGTTSSQRTVAGALADIARRAKEEGIAAPAVLVVGDVVRLSESLAWFERKALFGLRVLVTRPVGQEEELGRLLREQGAEPVYAPSIEIRGIEASAELVRELAAKEWDWIIFTSSNGVRHSLRQLQAAGLDVRAMGKARLAAIGSGTARALAALGLSVAFVPARYTSAALGVSLPEPVRGARILIPRAAQAPRDLPDALAERGAQVTEWPVYETIPAAMDKEALAKEFAEGRIDAVALTSSSTARSLAAAAGAEALAKVDLVCIGPVTAQAVRALGLEPAVVAEEHTTAGLVRAMVETVASRREGGKHDARG
jgi:uroporphyrinogen III methyltransferase/synthase